MSWIKLDNGLLGSIRFARVVARLRNSSNALRNASVQHAETAVLGALARLWSYADGHVLAGNLLEATPGEIDELVGLDGFASALPAQWLVERPDGYVELPDFLEKNGSSQKQRTDNARRQAAYRDRQRALRAAGSDPPVTHNAPLRNGSNEARGEERRREETRAEHTQSARAREGAAAPADLPDRQVRLRSIPGGDAWRDVGCSAEAYEGWLLYREETGETVPATVRIEHAKFLLTKGAAAEQAAFVAECIRRQFKRLHDPAFASPAQKRWRTPLTTEQLEEAERLGLDAETYRARILGRQGETHAVG